jgi:hypothetical protein
MSTAFHLSWVVSAGVLVLGASVLAQPLPAPGAAPAKGACLFTIGPDTTRVSGPVKADGTIDYFAAYNAERSAGVTPDNNAAVLILHVVGASQLHEGGRAQVLAAMNLSDMPAEGLYVWDGSKLGMEGDDYSDFYGRLHQGPWREKDRPHAAAYLRANDRALTLLAQAASRARFWMPVYPDHETVLYQDDPSGKPHEAHPPSGLRRPVNMTLRAPVEALAARAMLRLGKGDAAGARDDLLAVHRLSRLMAHGGALADNLVGISCDAMVCRADWGWVGDSRISGPLAKEYLAQLQALGPTPSLHDAIDVANRYEALEAVMNLRTRKVQGLSEDMQNAAKELLAEPAIDNLDWNRLLRLVNRVCDAMVSVADRPFPQQETAWADVRDQMRGALDGDGDRFEPIKPVAEYMLTRAGSLLAAACKARENVATQFDITLVALAARAFYAANAKWPEDLNDLVPNYLKAVPADRFAEGDPLAARIQGDALVIWSVGPKGDGTATYLRAELQIKPPDK